MQRTAQLSKKMQDALNDQIQNELFSGYQYLGMSAFLETRALPGAAHWMRVQAKEELDHAMRFYDFITDRNGRVVLAELPKPTSEYKSPLDIFEQAYANEQKVTATIINLYELAVTEKDYASHAFLQEFLTEQIEEEKNALRLVEMFQMAGDNPSALLMLDKELASRTGTH